MKSTGIVRGLDSLGRVVLPIELRRSLNLGEHDRVEIFSAEGQIILRKFEPNCCFCGSAKNLMSYQDKLVCGKCIEKLQTLRERQHVI